MEKPELVEESKKKKPNQGSKDPDKGVKEDRYEQEILSCHSVSMGKPRVQS